jgi:hypothetical protein
VSFTGSQRAKRSRTGRAIRQTLVPALIAVGRLRAADAENLEAFKAARDELCLDWARLASLVTQDPLRRSGDGE